MTQQVNSQIDIFDGASNVQLGVKHLKVRYPKLTVVCGVEHTVSLLLNYTSKITIFHKIIAAHEVINNIFGSGINHKPHSILKLKFQEFLP